MHLGCKKVLVVRLRYLVIMARMRITPCDPLHARRTTAAHHAVIDDFGFWCRSSATGCKA